MRHRRVLIAEDDETSVRQLKTTLVHWGYEVQVCRDGSEALRVLEQPDSPEISLLDWMMPGLDGTEVCRELRRTKEGASKYLILLTSRSDKEDLVQGLRSGADDYIVKPFHLGELRARLLVGTRILSAHQELADKVVELTAALEATRQSGPARDGEPLGLQDGEPITVRESLLEMRMDEEC